MPKPSQFIRICVTLALVLATLALGYPAAFVVQHGWNPAAWPSQILWTPAVWFSTVTEINVYRTLETYWMMGHSALPAFSDGGFFAFAVIGSGAIFLGAITLLGGTVIPLRDPSHIYGDAQWASLKDRERLNKGLEIGRDPETGRPIRIQVEGNLITIAPPRTGKTGGFIIANLAFPDPNAWAGPAVVIDPKGDIYRAVKRRREAMGRKVRCLDPLNLVRGTDRWNPILRIDPNDVLYLKSMASALSPPVTHESDAGSFYRNSAAVLIAAAIIVSIKNGRADPVGASDLLMNEADFREALEKFGGKSKEGRKILKHALNTLNMEDPRTKSNAIHTASQNMECLYDERMQAVVQNHTFELSDLADGNTDLFIVLPADPTKTQLAPYVRWLLADLFAAVRKNRPVERIVVFIDEAYVLGPFKEIIEAAGELPGYGLSLWTFWQSRHQMEDTYGPLGAEILMGTAEMINIFNLMAAQPEELERWSNAIGIYTGFKTTTTFDGNTGKKTETRSPEALRLIPPDKLKNFLNKHQVVFLNSVAHTPDALKLERIKADTDPRFSGIVDLIPPVGRIG